MTSREDIIEAGAKEVARQEMWRMWKDDAAHRDEARRYADAALTAMLPLILAGVADGVRSRAEDANGPRDAHTLEQAARIIERWTP